MEQLYLLQRFTPNKHLFHMKIALKNSQKLIEQTEADSLSSTLPVTSGLKTLT